MARPPYEFPDIELPRDEFSSTAPHIPVQRPAYMSFAHRPARRDALLKYLLLFALTVLTTTYAGQGHYASFIIGFSNRVLTMTATSLFIHGLWYSVSILGILGAHELGHYYACRYYRVDASRPYFLPAPLPLTGTFGAFIRIRQPIPGKRALFDIGIAGPIAGFLVAIPVLLIGMYMSTVIPVPSNFNGQIVELGEPLLFNAAAWLTFGSVPDGYTVNMHPMAFAAWFGMLATALNLFPIGQFDGGHISYAVLGRKSSMVTLATIGCAALLVLVSLSWILWTVLAILMLLRFGRHHPRTFDEDVPLDRRRRWLALFAVVMFILCFTPAPIEPLQLLR